ncbi:MAG: Flp pilus assembly protein CpaB [Rhodospirillales bacterium]|nr:Flp pilus assembly protein CpaB [Rhodospirillales bacterium]
MNRNVVIVLVGGMLVAVLVAALVQASLSGGKKNASVQTAAAPKVQIITAAKALDVGTELTDSNVKWQDWPKDAVFPGAIVRKGEQKPGEAVSGRLRRNMAEGEPITETALVPEKEGNFMAASLAEGMRAVAVDVKAADLAGGFIGPGDYVDVILTYKSSIRAQGDDVVARNTIERNLDKLATETVLENVRVLAVGRSAERDDDENSKVGKTVTLELDRKGAEVMALASEMGEVRLALRKLGDKTVAAAPTPVTTDARMTRVFDEVQDEIVKAKKSSGKDTNIVRVYSGGALQEVSVSQ